MKIKLILILLTLSSLGCSSNHPKDEISQLEYTFYSITLDSVFGNEKNIILRDSLVVPYFDEMTGPTIFADNKDLTPKYRIDKDLLSNNERVELIPRSYLAEIEKGKHEQFWDNLFEEFPNSVGWVTLSTVSYNEDSTQASFFINQGCGPYCGGEKEIVFEKVNQNWELTYVMQIGEL